MNQVKKNEIKESLKMYIHTLGSANKAATAMGISSATVSSIVNNNWDLIRNDMWRKVAAHLGVKKNEWTIVKTRDFKVIGKMLEDCQSNSTCYAITGDAGTGKTQAFRSFSNDNQNVFMLCCSEFWNKKYFLSELLTCMGRESSGMTTPEMVQTVVRNLRQIDSPVIIMDEADKLNDNVLYFFITLYNQLEDQCGMVLAATDHLGKVIRRGLKLNKKGYKEIYSRLGKNIVELNGLNTTDVAQVCMSNGVDDKAMINKIFNECDNDLRRVKRLVQKAKQLMTEA